MRTLAFPIRITQDGQLARAEGAESLLRLIQAMAATMAGSWPHAPWFGLHELFLKANMSVEEQSALTDALNEAFRKLDIGWATVHSVKSADNLPPGERRFDITLLIEGERPQHRQLAT